jgi:hypothetical protein
MIDIIGQTAERIAVLLGATTSSYCFLRCQCAIKVIQKNVNLLKPKVTLFTAFFNSQ